MGREALLRYVLRPPIAQERLEQRPDGLVRITLKKAYADGTVAVDTGGVNSPMVAVVFAALALWGCGSTPTVDIDPWKRGYREWKATGQTCYAELIARIERE